MQTLYSCLIHYKMHAIVWKSSVEVRSFLTTDSKESPELCNSNTIVMQLASTWIYYRMQWKKEQGHAAAVLEGSSNILSAIVRILQHYNAEKSCFQRLFFQQCIVVTDCSARWWIPCASTYLFIASCKCLLHVLNTEWQSNCLIDRSVTCILLQENPLDYGSSYYTNWVRGLDCV